MADIEDLAVSKVMEEVGYTDTLAQGILRKDKTPLWDGSILIFGNEKKSISDIVKQVLTQVKGRSTKKPFPKIKKHGILITDLKSYLENGGVLYFYVSINKEKRERKIYYYALSPSIIQKLLLSVNKSEQKTISVDLKPLPENSAKITAIVRNFYNESKRQRSFVDKVFPSIDEILRGNKAKQFVIQPPFSNESSIRNLIGMEFTVYAKDANWDILIPTRNTVTLNRGIVCDNRSINVNGEKYYNNFTRILESERTIVQVGKSLQIIFDKEPERGKEIKMRYNIRIAGNLEERIKELEFIIAILINNGLSIENKFVPLFSDKMPGLDSEIEKFKAYKELYSDYALALEKVGLKANIDLEKLSEHDINNLDFLARIVNHDEVFSNVDKKYLPTCRLRIGDLVLLLMVFQAKEKQTDEPVYFIQEMFSSNGNLISNHMDTTSKFALLHPKDLIEVSNIDFQSIIGDIKANKPSEFHLICVNQLMLRAVIAYDLTNEKKYLIFARNLSDYIRENIKFTDYEVWLINDCQIKARENKITDSDKEEIKKLLFSSNQQKRFSGAVLLDNKEVAEDAIAKMAETELDEIKEYPIYNLFKKESKNG